MQNKFCNQNRAEAAFFRNAPEETLCGANLLMANFSLQLGVDAK